MSLRFVILTMLFGVTTVWPDQPAHAPHSYAPSGFDAGGGRQLSSNYSGFATIGGWLGAGSLEAAPVSLQPGFANLINDPPQPHGDAAVLAAQTPVHLTTAHLLSNDADLEGDTLTLISLASLTEQGGTVVQNGNQILYTPPQRLTGLDAFKYSVTDSWGDEASGTVFLFAPSLGQDPDQSWLVINPVASPTGPLFRIVARVPSTPAIALESSTNLNHWQQRWSQPPTFEAFEFIDQPSLASYPRFYRTASSLAPSQSLRLDAFRMLSNGGVDMRLQRIPAPCSVLQVSTDLIHWQALTTNQGPEKMRILTDLPPRAVALLFLPSVPAPLTKPDSRCFPTSPRTDSVKEKPDLKTGQKDVINAKMGKNLPSLADPSAEAIAYGAPTLLLRNRGWD